jgi:hypothetical protein
VNSSQCHLLVHLQLHKQLPWVNRADNKLSCVLALWSNLAAPVKQALQFFLMYAWLADGDLLTGF